MEDDVLNIIHKQIAASFLIFGLFYGMALAGGVEQGANHKVGMEYYEFAPAELTIQAGDTVTWLNNDNRDHDLAFYEVKPVNAPTDENPQDMRVDEKYSLVFNQAGVFKYLCTIHKRQDMKGLIIVK